MGVTTESCGRPSRDKARSARTQRNPGLMWRVAETELHATCAGALTTNSPSWPFTPDASRPPEQVQIWHQVPSTRRSNIAYSASRDTSRVAEAETLTAQPVHVALSSFWICCFVFLFLCFLICGMKVFPAILTPDHHGRQLRCRPLNTVIGISTQRPHVAAAKKHKQWDIRPLSCASSTSKFVPMK